MRQMIYNTNFHRFCRNSGFLERIWTIPEHEYVGVSKSLFKNATINIKVQCDPLGDPNMKINITWILRKTRCWNEYLILEENQEIVYQELFNSPQNYYIKEPSSFFISDPQIKDCNHNIILKMEDIESILESKEDKEAAASQAEARAAAKRSPPVSYGLQESHVNSENIPKTNHPVAIIPADGVYLLIIHTTQARIEPGKNLSYKTEINIEMKNTFGYLSAVDYPLLGFYGAMCFVYVIYALGWLIVSFMRWRELLRVQYWISGVIFLGMLEKAVFTAEYQNINLSGTSIPGLIIFAELVSCAKRTVARMLIIIVSQGFGIVKPRLGIVLQRVVGVGLIYFVLASIEGCTRELQPRNDPQKQVMMASLPLALLESAICFWIFTALVATTRTLRLRRNLTKLALYRHFTTTLAFAVIASVIFMLWSIRYHKLEECLNDWKELWVDDAYWHLLFALVLLVIMILWRPTNNNQRFAFSPLLDDGSDADDEEESEKLMADISDTLTLRNTRTGSTSSPKEARSVEDDLKWVEENIPSSLADSALPILDSDEEIVTSKFEISKMQ
ncbi:unnamed protein product, partial [Meganyctiphanes norvegica]